MIFLLIILYIGLLSVSLVVIQKLERILNNFLDKNIIINDQTALNEYKSSVRQCMYISLVIILIIVIATCISIALMFYKGFFASVSFIIFRLLLNGFGKEAMELEKKARALDCANSDLEEQYQRISHTWVKKALPDF